MNRVAAWGIGLSLVLIGVLTIFQRGYYDSGFAQYIDFGEHHSIIGILTAALGLWWI